MTIKPNPRIMELVRSYEFTAPANYVHALQVEKFKENFKDKYNWFDKIFTDENCKNATYKLMPCMSYRAHLLRPGPEAMGKDFNDCPSFLFGTDLFWGHIQALTLLCELLNEKDDFFPKRELREPIIWSPDKPETLPKKESIQAELMGSFLRDEGFAKDEYKVPRVMFPNVGKMEITSYSSRTTLKNDGSMYLVAFELLHAS